MLADVLRFLLDTGFDLLASAFFLRFWMQWARAPFNSPLAQAVLRITRFAVHPLRRVLPGFGGLDWASLLAMLLTLCLSETLIRLVQGFPFLVAGADILPRLALLGLAASLEVAVYVLMGLVIVQAVLSWVNPYSPHAPMIYGLTAPLLTPLRRIVPPISGIDLTPLAALVLLQLLLIAPVNLLRGAAL